MTVVEVASAMSEAGESRAEVTGSLQFSWRLTGAQWNYGTPRLFHLAASFRAIKHLSVRPSICRYSMMQSTTYRITG